MKHVHRKIVCDCLSLKIIVIIVLGIVLWCSNALTLTEPVKIGNPGLEQFPNNDPADCFARSVWDMQCHNGSIYIGAGDYWTNRGPIDVWSFDAGGDFRMEYKMDEEQVDIFRGYGGKLFIPGKDATESWAYGNLYIKDNDKWQKLRTIPNGIHVRDVALFKGNICVSISSSDYYEVLESSDMGQTWKSLARSALYESGACFVSMVALDDSLIFTGTTDSGQPCVYRYIDGNIETLVIPKIPGSGNGKSFGRLARYGDGILYIRNYVPWDLKSSSTLFFMNDFSSSPISIEEFQRESVRDIVVRNDICYILTASAKGKTFQGQIYSSPDLGNWTKLAEFSVPAPPYSFEYLDGIFYVGLGSKNARKVYVESGSIYKLDLTDVPLLASQPSNNSKHKLSPAGLPAAPQTTMLSTVLYPNYPNPFNPDTWIPYQLREDLDVAIRIYNAAGQHVRMLNLGHKPAGFYTEKAKAAYWDGKNEAGEQVSSGIYFYTIQAGDFTATKKMVIAQ